VIFGFSSARIIATSLIHLDFNYCNCLFLNLPQSQRGCLQLIPNSSARAVSKTPKFVLKSLHWLKMEQRIHYKVASITYKVPQSEQPSYLDSLLNVQSNRTTVTVTYLLTFGRGRTLPSLYDIEVPRYAATHSQRQFIRAHQTQYMCHIQSCCPRCRTRESTMR